MSESVSQNRPTSALTDGRFALSSSAETTLITSWVTERQRGEGCEVFRVCGDSWETAHSSFSQNIKWAQHNILKTDKIPPFHPLYLPFVRLLIHYRYLTTAAGAKGAMKHTRTHKHKHTRRFLKHTGAHQVSCGNLF